MSACRDAAENLFQCMRTNVCHIFALAQYLTDLIPVAYTSKEAEAHYQLSSIQIGKTAALVSVVDFRHDGHFSCTSRHTIGIEKGTKRTCTQLLEYPRLFLPTKIVHARIPMCLLFLVIPYRLFPATDSIRFHTKITCEFECLYATTVSINPLRFQRVTFPGCPSVAIISARSARL
jgi:hypothetical protein